MHAGIRATLKAACSTPASKKDCRSIHRAWYHTMRIQVSDSGSLRVCYAVCRCPSCQRWKRWVGSAPQSQHVRRNARQLGSPKTVQKTQRHTSSP